MLFRSRVKVVKIEKVASAPPIYDTTKTERAIPAQSLYQIKPSSKNDRAHDRGIGDQVEIQGILCTAISSPRSMIDNEDWREFRRDGKVDTKNTRLFRDLEYVEQIANSDSQRELARHLSRAFEDFGNGNYVGARTNFERARKIVETKGTIQRDNSWVQSRGSFYDGLRDCLDSYSAQAKELASKKPDFRRPLMPRE